MEASDACEDCLFARAILPSWMLILSLISKRVGVTMAAIIANSFGLFIILLVAIASVETVRNARQQKQKQFVIYRYDQDAIRSRRISNQIHPMILARRSLREMNGEPLDPKVLMSLFEAARWAPSHYNLQPWRFVYSLRGTPKFEQMLETLSPGNVRWAKDSAALVVVLSSRFQLRKGEKIDIPSHSFDAGAATMALALEGTARGLVIHPMGGFDNTKVAESIELPNENDFRIEVVIAIGHRAFPASSSEKTSQRLDFDKFAREGVFNFGPSEK